MSETPCPFCGQIHGTACEVTIPANPTDQVAATTATRGDIASHEGDAAIHAVVQDAQRSAWREDLDSIEACEEVWECADGCCTGFMPRHNDECIRLAALIECLEAEMEDALAYVARVEATNETVIAERDALLAEYEVVDEGYGDETADGGCDCLSCRIIRAHDNAKRVMHRE